MTLVSHQTSLLVFLLIVLLISLSNLRAIPRLGARRRRGEQDGERLPRVSILVPARNEAKTIEACLTSLLAQDYPDTETLVLDDSDDETSLILDSLQTQNRIRVIRSRPLPPGWMGKNWACHQLSREATGDLLLFVDADTTHAPAMLREAVALLEWERLGLLSVLPRQRVSTWAERLILPILPWSLQTFYPFALARWTGWRVLAAAVGQVMLFRREVYDRIGGHGAVRSSVLDDRELVRRVADHGLRWALADAGPLASVRMYTHPREVWNGLSKNLFAIFSYNLPLFLFVWSWLLWLAWEPPILLILYAARVPWVASAVVGPAAAATAIGLGLWWISNRRFGLPKAQTVLHPFTLALVYLIALRSVAWRYLGLGAWKGRPLLLPSGVIRGPRSKGSANRDPRA